MNSPKYNVQNTRGVEPHPRTHLRLQSNKYFNRARLGQQASMSTSISTADTIPTLRLSLSLILFGTVLSQSNALNMRKIGASILHVLHPSPYCSTYRAHSATFAANISPKAYKSSILVFSYSHSTNDDGWALLQRWRCCCNKNKSPYSIITLMRLQICLTYSIQTAQSTV